MSDDGDERAGRDGDHRDASDGRSGGRAVEDWNDGNDLDDWADDGEGLDRSDGPGQADREGRDERARSLDRGELDARSDDADRKEPLGDVAARVRERTDRRRESADPPTREGPLADVASAVDERRRRGRESDDAFESVDVGELDGEKLWERLAEGGDGGPAATVPPGESVAADDERDGRDVRTVPKDTCHGCPHFGDPPELACTHEGTAILAMTDADHFRVADCPMVGEEDVGSISVEDVEGDGGNEVGGDDGEVG